MKLVLALLLSTICFPVMAATVSANTLVGWVVSLIVLGIICGLLIFLVRKAPFIPPEWKTGIEYLIYLVVVLIVIGWLLGFVGQPSFNIR
jgi:drug/metabolite transporter (DMT)-like permease